MKVALAQTNPVVGDIDGNSRKILRFVRDAERVGADLVVFPELAVLGYPPRDLLLKKTLIRDNLAAVERIAAQTGPTTVVVGYARPNETPRGKTLWNTAAVCREGRIVANHGKHLLPTYDVFDESRYFQPCPELAVARVPAGGRDVPVGVSICEDLWNEEQLDGRRLYDTDPIRALVNAGAELLLNLSASPFYVDKQARRIDLFGKQVVRYGIPLVYVNQVGGNDDLLFDGASAVLAADGSLIAQARAFEEDLLIVDLDNRPAGPIHPYPGPVAGVYEALVMGTRDYVNKCGFSAVVIGLSGGIDSAVTAVLAAAALGPDRVHTVAMPSRFSSDHSLSDAAVLAGNLGVDHRVIPIERMHAAVESELRPHFGDRAADVTEENIQARVRGNVLMSLSNKFGWLLLTTGNKSELAVGYCTLYGDMCGGLAVISDVPKTMVYDLARYVNQEAGRDLIPNGTITKPPSAELRPNQTDQDSLPPYDVLDAILRLYVEEEFSTDEIVARGFEPAVVKDVIRKVDVNEYKRKQAAVGLKVTTRAFGTGRRMPIAAKYGWEEGTKAPPGGGAFQTHEGTK
jgi:NAD+ synthetase